MSSSNDNKVPDLHCYENIDDILTDMSNRTSHHDKHITNEDKIGKCKENMSNDYVNNFINSYKTPFCNYNRHSNNRYSNDSGHHLEMVNSVFMNEISEDDPFVVSLLNMLYGCVGNEQSVTTLYTND